MLAGNVVTIGDSWAWLIAANAPGSAPPAAAFDNSFQQMLDANHPGTTVYNESYGGGTAFQHVLDLNGITSRINAHPDADIVWLSTGGNDIVQGSFVGGYDVDHTEAENQLLKERIVEDVAAIANHILGLRPDIQVVIAGYDYGNMWDTFTPVSAGNLTRYNLYGILPGDDALAANGAFHAYLREVGFGENGTKSIADNSSRIHYINNFGYHTSMFGYDGYLGTVPGTGTFPPDLYPDLPTDESFIAFDGIHLNSTGYLNLAQHGSEQFFSTALQNASLATSTSTLDFGNVRVGDSSASQTVSASNAGPNFTKVQNLIFPGTAGEFTGNGSAHDPLFQDPTLGSDTATSSGYRFTPSNRGAAAANLTVTSDSGSQPLALSGMGVGPVYDSVSTIDFGTVTSGGTALQLLDIGNFTTDGDLGSLTDLTLLTATISGADAAAFSIDDFVPQTVLEAGATQNYTIEFDPSGLSPGAKTAVLTFTTDEGSSFGTLGAQFQIIISAGVDPATADIGGPYSGDEGTLIALSGAGSSGATLYEWDLDNDGQYDDAVGVNPNFNATDNGVFTIGLRINGVGGPTDSTTVTVNNVAPTASISGTTAIYRGETVTFTLNAVDASPVDQAGLFDFEIDWDGNGSVDETLLGVPDGTTVMHTFPTTFSGNVQVRATDKDAATGSFSQLPIDVTAHVLRDDGFGNTDLIWGGTELLDAVFVFGSGASLSLFVQLENLVTVNRLDAIGPGVTGKIIMHGYGFPDVLVADFATGNSLELHGGDGDDVLVGGFLGDTLYGNAGNDVLLGGTQFIDGADQLFGGEGKDTLFGHWGADTLNGGADEDLLMGDRYAFADIPSAVLTIHNEWVSGRPYAERVTNIQGITNTGVNDDILSTGVTIAEDGDVDTLIGGLGEMDWFLYTFGEDILGDVIEPDEEETDTSL